MALMALIFFIYYYFTHRLTHNILYLFNAAHMCLHLKLTLRKYFPEDFTTMMQSPFLITTNFLAPVDQYPLPICLSHQSLIAYNSPFKESSRSVHMCHMSTVTFQLVSPICTSLVQALKLVESDVSVDLNNI